MIGGSVLILDQILVILSLGSLDLNKLLVLIRILFFVDFRVYFGFLDIIILLIFQVLWVFLKIQIFLVFLGFFERLAF